MNGVQQPPADAEALLAQLHDILAPEPVGLWPLAYGWWLLLAVLAAAILIAVLAAFRVHRADRYRRQALAELNALPADSSAEGIQQLARLLKRTALSAYPMARDRLPGLHGAPWIAFLNACCKQPVFSAADAALLTEAQYAPAAQTIDAEIRTRVRYWLMHHQRSEQQLQKALHNAQGEPARV